MKWVTWQNVGVDRMGCAWLIQHFIDTQAEFLFIPQGQATMPEGYLAFDIPGARFTHRGHHCTFHSLLTDYQLNDPVLHRLANILDEADISQEFGIEPIAHGLDAICRGIRLISADDFSAIQHGFIIYDALYAQLSKG